MDNDFIESESDILAETPPCIYGHFDCSMNGKEGGPCFNENAQLCEQCGEATTDPMINGLCPFCWHDACDDCYRTDGTHDERVEH